MRWLTLLGLLCWHAAGAVPPDRLETLARGANISTLLEHKSDVSLELTQLGSLGFRHVRAFVSIEQLDDPVYLRQLDSLIRQALSHQLGIILCMAAKSQMWRDESVATARPLWLAGWQKLAHHLRDTPAEQVFLELTNEPELHDSKLWEHVQRQLYTTVRGLLPRHTIILTGSPTSMVWSLADQPDVNDPNVLYAVHLYQPMAVTCQGCACCPQYAPIHGLAYPPDPANIRQVTTAATAAILAEYGRDGGHVLQQEIDLAATWSGTHHVPIIATEFGIFSAAPLATRAAWLRAARQGLEKAHIGWTIWEYEGGFGVAPLHPHTPIADALGVGR